MLQEWLKLNATYTTPDSGLPKQVELPGINVGDSLQAPSSHADFGLRVRRKHFPLNVLEEVVASEKLKAYQSHASTHMQAYTVQELVVSLSITTVKHT